MSPTCVCMLYLASDAKCTIYGLEITHHFFSGNLGYTQWNWHFSSRQNHNLNSAWNVILIYDSSNHVFNLILHCLKPAYHWSFHELGSNFLIVNHSLCLVVFCTLVFINFLFWEMSSEQKNNNMRKRSPSCMKWKRALPSCRGWHWRILYR